MKYLYIIIPLMLMFSCNEIDNYDEPNSALQGKIIDDATDQLLTTAQSASGVQIFLQEKGSLQPTTFWAKSDGTFVNTRVFSGDYSLTAVGAFIMISDTINTHIPTKEELVLRVEPYLRIDASANIRDDTSAIIKFNIKKSNKWNRNLTKYTILYSTTTAIDYDNSLTRTNVTVADETTVLNKEIEFLITKIKSDKPIFVRIAAQTAGTSLYNYSPIIQLK